MNRMFFIPVGLLSLLASGCINLTGMPDAAPNTGLSQPLVKSVKHWDLIADDVAAETMKLGRHPGFFDQRFHVVVDQSNEFGAGFGNMLITRLVNSGFPVAVVPEDSAKIVYEVQVVRHPTEKTAYPGRLTQLAGGILVLRELLAGDLSENSATATAAGLLAGVDLAGAAGRLYRPTNTEIIVTTTVANNGVYAMRKTDTYYIPGEAARLYEESITTQSRRFGVSGS